MVTTFIMLNMLNMLKVECVWHIHRCAQADYFLPGW